MNMICRNIKRRNVEGEKLDRLTNLPINVKYRIQQQLSVEEAARMSVLSTPWRHVWASNPKLVFSPQFCQRKPLTDVIHTILLQHCGDIKTFSVNISSIPYSQHSVIDQWMLILSRNGVTDLTLQNQSNALYKLPSCIYDRELEGLRLSNCIFKPPCDFRGFHKLKNLTLHQVVLELNDVTSFLWMPYLVTLQVRACSGFPDSKIYAPRLSEIFFLTKRTENLELGHFMDFRKLKTVILLSSKQNQDRTMNLTYLLKCWPEIHIFALDSYYLKSFATEAERLLPAYLDSLNALTLFEFDFDDEDQISSLLRMLRVSPNLDLLHLVLSSKKKKKTDGMEVINVVNHFEGPAYRTLGVLHKLQRLMIKNFHGSKMEMFFVKFIFASAPLLLKTVIHEDAESVDESQSLNISELLGFPQTSPKLKMHVNRRANRSMLAPHASSHVGG